MIGSNVVKWFHPSLTSLDWNLCLCESEVSDKMCKWKTELSDDRRKRIGVVVDFKALSKHFRLLFQQRHFLKLLRRVGGQLTFLQARLRLGL